MGHAARTGELERGGTGLRVRPPRGADGTGTAPASEDRLELVGVPRPRVEIVGTRRLHLSQTTPRPTHQPHAADNLLASTADGCALYRELADTGVDGAAQIAPGANLPGQPLAAETLAFLARVAGIYGKPLIVTTGTNHSYYTVNGTVSDHASGHPPTSAWPPTTASTTDPSATRS